MCLCGVLRLVLLLTPISHVCTPHTRTPAHPTSTGEWNDFYFATKVGILGWFLHYVPFWIMGRVTYLHHYFPALYFAILTFTVLVDHVAKRLLPRHQTLVMGVLMVAFAWNFWYFSGFVFGLDGPVNEYPGRQWLSTWNMYEEEK